MTARTYLLVHGAWHGGWCWVRVADRLRAAGHRVFTPTHTGVGERAHLLSAGITMDTYVQDLVNVIEFEDLQVPKGSEDKLTAVPSKDGKTLIVTLTVAQGMPRTTIRGKLKVHLNHPMAPMKEFLFNGFVR